MRQQFLHAKNKSQVLIVSILAVVSLLLSGCGLTINPANATLAPASLLYPDELGKTELVNVLFKVKLQAPIASSEKLVVDLVDEVSGLPFNFARHEMQQLDALNFQITLPLPLGSDIKYRYAQTGSSIQSEMTALGTEIRYRLLHVVRGLQVQDMAVSWPNSPYLGPIGKLHGKISNSSGEVGLPDILISVAGYQTYTDMAGKFIVDGIPPGIHNLVAYAIDGSYQTFQQTVNIMENLETPASISLSSQPEVNVTFIVTAPDDAVGAPIRFAGNFYQLGNTFADLHGDVSTLASRMPILTRMDDGRHMITLKLHAGNDLRYKYTLGDGYWNAERKLNGDMQLRQVIVPGKEVIIEESIETWRVETFEPAMIQVTVPENTPVTDSISIQFNQHSWMQPIPMWPMGSYQWLYLLFSPLDFDENISYRFCRNDQCGTAYDLDSYNSPYLIEKAGTNNFHEVATWKNWDPPDSPTTIVAADIPMRDAEYLTGIELSSLYHPSFQNRYGFVFNELYTIGTNWVVLTPTWQVNALMNSPLLEPLPGASPMVQDLINMAELAKESGLQVALFPQLEFGVPSLEWWHATEKSALWWQEWYVEYERFLDNYAQLANIMNADKMIIGGEFIQPTLPGGIQISDMVIGTPSNAEEIWTNILERFRSAYQGEVVWAMPFTGLSDEFPAFLEKVDALYILFDAQISFSSYTHDIVSIEANIGEYLDNDLYPIKSELNLPIFVGFAYPSADGGGQACVLNIYGQCTESLMISPEYADLGSDQVDLQEQVNLYNALCQAIIERDWIDGIISRGYYPPVKLTDFSSSVNGKPAMDVLWYWYSGVKEE